MLLSKVGNTEIECSLAQSWWPGGPAALSWSCLSCGGRRAEGRLGRPMARGLSMLRAHGRAPPRATGHQHKTLTAAADPTAGL